MIKKSILVFVIMAILASGAMAVEKVNLRAIRFDEVVEPGIEIPFYISVKNIHDKKIHDVSVTVDSPDMDIYRSSDDVELRAGDVASFTVPIDIPGNVKPGEYTIRFRISYGDDMDRHYYRVLVVR